MQTQDIMQTITLPRKKSPELLCDQLGREQLRVHSIETFGTHDGPGIRLVVFVQGCVFRCLYCANPDTMDRHAGRLMDVEEIVKRAVAQKPYFGRKGGVTISGGEPLLQRKVLKKLFERLHEEGIHTALDSNGVLIDQAAKDLLEVSDLLLLDVKHIDNEVHKQVTGCNNRNVLKVAQHREASGKAFWLRYVLVPGLTDKEEHLHQLGRHFQHFRQIEKIEIQPYHRLGAHKWEALGKTYQLEGVPTPSRECISNASAIFGQYFKEVKVN